MNDPISNYNTPASSDTINFGVDYQNLSLYYNDDLTALLK